MDFKARDMQISSLLGSDIVVSFKIDSSELKQAGKLCDDLQKRSIKLSISEWREKRSASANAYAWTLLQQLADKQGIGLLECYRHHIEECGVFQDIHIQEKAKNTFIHVWKEKGVGWICDELEKDGEYAVIRAYYGSSSYNSKQMARLIDLIVQDCEAVGIVTKTPEEIAKLVSLIGVEK